MEVSFSPIAETGKPLSRCGKCHRFMKYIQVSKTGGTERTNSAGRLSFRARRREASGRNLSHTLRLPLEVLTHV